jgi:YVTN family beta-propeller protein
MRAMLRTSRLLAVYMLVAGCREQSRHSEAQPTAMASAAPSAIASAAPSASVAAIPKPRGPRVYVSNEDSNDISIIDALTDEVAGTIFVGKRPRGIRLSPDGKRIFVALSGSPKEPPGAARDAGRPPADRAADGIAIVDVAEAKLLRSIPSGKDPECFDFSPDGKLLYVSNEEAAQATVIEVSTGRIVQTIALDEEPEGVTMKPAGDVVYVTSEAANKVFAIDTKDNTVKATIETGPRPRAVAFTPDGARGFITEEQGSSITVVDAKKHKPLSHIKLEGTTHKPMGAIASSDGKTIYVTTGRGGAVLYIDAQTARVKKTIEHVGVRPWGIGVSPDGSKLYTANGPSNDVSVIDVATGEIKKKLPAGSLPWGVAVSRASGD